MVCIGKKASSVTQKGKLLYEPALLLLGVCVCVYMYIHIYSKGETIYIPKAGHNTQRWKQLKCSCAGEWISQIWSIHTMEYYSVLKME